MWVDGHEFFFLNVIERRLKTKVVRLKFRHVDSTRKGSVDSTRKGSVDSTRKSLWKIKNDLKKPVNISYT